MNTEPVKIVYEMRFTLFSILIRFHFVLPATQSPLHLANSLAAINAPNMQKSVEHKQRSVGWKGEREGEWDGIVPHTVVAAAN